MIDFDAETKGRDARLRFAILKVLDAAKALAPGLRARKLMGYVRDCAGTDEFDDDRHFVRLLRDLETSDYLTLRDLRTHKGDRYGADMLDAAIADKGIRFVAGFAPADPLIDDGRIAG